MCVPMFVKTYYQLARSLRPAVTVNEALAFFFPRGAVTSSTGSFMADSRTTASSIQLVLPLLAIPGAVAAHVAL